MLVHNGKLKIQEEFAQKEKDLEIQQRVYVVQARVRLRIHSIIILAGRSRSTAIGNSRVKKMKARDELLEVNCNITFSIVPFILRHSDLEKRMCCKASGCCFLSRLP